VVDRTVYPHLHALVVLGLRARALLVYRLFNRSIKERIVNPERTQRLRNFETMGRKYDLITGAEVVVLPPNIPERIEIHKSHPSLMYTSKFR
jgi:hypothetical protein